MSSYGAKPELAWLPVAKLDYDARYQRTLESERSKALIIKIAAGFSWVKFGVIVAVPRGERWNVVDGQHRIEGAKLVKVDHVPAVVHADLSIEQQAAAFVGTNLDRVTVHRFSLYHAQLVAGEETAKAIAKVCDACGVTIPRYPVPSDKIKPGATLALGTIEQIVSKSGVYAGKVILRVVADAYGHVPGGISAVVLRAAWNIYSETLIDDRTATMRAMASFFGKIDAAQLISKGRIRREGYGGAEWVNVAAVIKTGIAAERGAAAVVERSGISRERLMAGR